MVNHLLFPRILPTLNPLQDMAGETQAKTAIPGPIFLSGSGRDRREMKATVVGMMMDTMIRMAEATKKGAEEITDGYGR